MGAGAGVAAAARQLGRGPVQRRLRQGGHGRRRRGLARQPAEIEDGAGLGAVGHRQEGRLGRIGEDLIDQGVQHLGPARQGRIEPVLFHQPAQALGVQQDIEGEAGRCLRRGQIVEDRAAQGREDLDLRLPVPRPHLAGRQQRQEAGRGGQRRRLQRGQQGRDRLPLGRRRHIGRGLRPVADDGIGVVHPAHELARRLDLVAVEKEDRHVLPAQHGHRLAGMQGAEAEVRQRHAAHLHHARQLGGRVGAVVPQAGPGLAHRQAACVGVGDVAQPPLGVLVQQGLARLAARPVQPGDGQLVPVADPHRIGVRQVDAPILQKDARRRIVHDAGAVLGAGGEVVRQADGVADLVGAQLAQAGERGLGRVVPAAGPDLVGADQAFEDQHVLAHAKGAQHHRAFEDLARAGVGHRLAIGPAAGSPVGPVDHAVADVQGVGVLRQQFDAEGVLVAGGLEGLGPPAGALHQGAADRLGRAAVHVEDDGLLHGRDRRGRVGLLQPEANGHLLDDRLTERGGEVQVELREGAAARIEGQRLIAGLGQLHEGVPDGDGEAAGLGRDVGDLLARLVGSEGLARLQLDILGKGLGRGGVHQGQVGDLAPALFARGLQRLGHAIGVGGQEAGNVDQDPAGGVGGDDVAGPDGGRREGLSGRGLLVGRRALGAETVVLVLGHHLAAHPAEGEDAALFHPAAVETDGRRAEPRAQGGHIDVAAADAGLVRRGEQHQDPALLGVDIEGNETVQPLQARHSLGHGLGRGEGRGRRADEDSRRRSGREKHIAEHL